MQTKDYTTNLLPLVRGLTGQNFAASEMVRLNAVINRRAKRAYDASNYWPRFLTVGEERTVTSSIVPYEQSGLSFIDTFLRIHRTAPLTAGSAQDYDFIPTFAGARLIAGGESPTSAFVSYRAQLRDTYGDGTNGTVTAVPDEWFQYIAHGTLADYLRMDGQHEKAALADAEAQDILTDELLKISNSRVIDLVGMRVMTNANMQSRTGVFYST